MEVKFYRHSKEFEKLKGIVHVTMPNRQELASAFIRLQEHYESQDDRIRGKIFTLGQIRAYGAVYNGGFNTYEGGILRDSDWGGYNFPGTSIQPFVKGLFDPLTDFEKDLVEIVRYKDPETFYIIGTVEGNDPREALDHEICHSMYFLSPKYKDEVDTVLKELPLETYNKLRNMMRSWGYCDEHIRDEIHAYLSADYEWLKTNKAEELQKFEIIVPKEIHLKLREIKTEYFDDDWLKG